MDLAGREAKLAEFLPAPSVSSDVAGSQALGSLTCRWRINCAFLMMESGQRQEVHYCSLFLVHISLCLESSRRAECSGSGFIVSFLPFGIFPET